MLTVVVPTYRTPDLAWSCIVHLLAFPAPGGQQIVLTDDGGGDDATAFIGSYLEATGHRFLALPENRGPFYAMNRGAEVGTGDALVFVNSDACVLPGCLAALCDWYARGVRFVTASQIIPRTLRHPFPSSGRSPSANTA